jgi:hypothetical protein
MALHHYLVQVRIVTPKPQRALTKLCFGEDQYCVNLLLAVSLGSTMCRECAYHRETASYILLQCSAGLLTCTLRRQLIDELRPHTAINIPANITDDYADFCLKRIIH